MNAPSLPLWIEYARALGAPLVALVAALAATTLTHRQWKTARNKLKLDLFDRRLAVYDAAWEMIGKLAAPERLKADDLESYLRKASGARWLFDAGVVSFLVRLQQEAQEALKTERGDAGSLSPVQRLELSLAYFERLETSAAQKMKELTSLMEPFLRIEA